MRRLWSVYVLLALVATQGCHRTLQHTAGVCDANPPPVESLLVGPCPSFGTPVTAANYTAGSYAAPRGAVVPGTGLVPVPAANNGKVINTPPVVAPTTPPPAETIKVLPKIGDTKK